MKLKPLNDKILVKPIVADEVTESGLIVKSTQDDAPRMGEVIAVDDNAQVKVGDKVMFGIYAGKPFTLGDEDLLAIHENDILIVFN